MMDNNTMTSQNLPALIDQFNPENFVSELTARGFYNMGFTPMHAAYLVVGEKKRLIMLDLEKKELELQSILLEPGTTITDKEATLARYRKGCEQIVELRKKFTLFIDEKVTDPTRIYEKRVDYKTNQAYINLANNLLNLKRQDELDKQKLNNKAMEIQNYKAHIYNQNIQIASEYEQAVVREINTMYNSYLEGRVEKPDIESLRQTVLSFIFREPNRFTRVHVNDDEALAIIESIPKLVFADQQKKALDYLDQRFSTYENDLIAVKSAPEVLEQIAEHSESIIQNIQTNTAVDQQINTLVASSTNTTVQVAPEGKAIKRKWKVIFNGTEEEHLKIIGAYIKVPECRVYLRVKNFKNLNCGQMADALGAYATEKQIKVDELIYELDEQL